MFRIKFRLWGRPTEIKRNIKSKITDTNKNRGKNKKRFYSPQSKSDKKKVAAVKTPQNKKVKKSGETASKNLKLK